MLHYIQKMRPSFFSSNFYHEDTEITELNGVFLALPSPHRLLAPSVSSSHFRSLAFLLSYHGDTEITELHGVFLALLSSLQSLSLFVSSSHFRSLASSPLRSLSLFVSHSLPLFSLSNTFFDHRYQFFFFIGFGNIVVAACH